jgi:hypothetical protein
MELETLLEQKAEEVRTSLQSFIRPYLGPGEKLEVSLKVVYDAELGKNQLLDLKAEDFFTYERMLATGADHNTATRIRTVLIREAEFYVVVEGNELTVREFLKKYTTGMVKDIPGVGAKSFELIVKVLEAEDLHLRGPRSA